MSDGDIIFIDGSTTCLFLPELIEDKKDITVLTNSLRLACMFKNNDTKVYCTGGCVRLFDEFVASGPIAESTCKMLHTNLIYFPHGLWMKTVLFTTLMSLKQNYDV